MKTLNISKYGKIVKPETKEEEKELMRIAIYNRQGTFFIPSKN